MARGGIGTGRRMAVGTNKARNLIAICVLGAGLMMPDRSRAEIAPVVPLPIKAEAEAVLSIADRDQSKLVLDAATRKKWTRARRLIKKVKNPLPHKFLDWLYFTTRGNKATFGQIANFIRANPDWPRQTALRRQAEAAIDDTVETGSRLGWFDQYPPVSGIGKIHLIDALNASGRSAEASELLKKTWIGDNFPYRLEQKIYKRYRKSLTPEDHTARLDRLLWEGRRQPARRMLERVEKGWQRLADARLALRRRSADVDRKVARVPDELKSDIGLVYERARWRRRKRLDDSARELLLDNGQLGMGDLDTTFANRVWTERAIQTRKALAKGEVTNAYRLASEHELREGPKLAEAEWLAGWVALRHLDDPEPAYKHFMRLHETVRYPISISRAAYWAARAATAMNDEKLANEWYTKATQYPATFYGQLAAQRLTNTAALELPPLQSADNAGLQSVHDHELVKVARMLKAIDQEKRLRPFIMRLFDLDPTTAQAAIVADIAQDLGRTDLAIIVTKRGARAGVLFPDRGYPVIDLPKPANSKAKGYQPAVHPEAALVLALSRQESAFNPKAVSRAGARGLMQLMPGTARATARMIRVTYSRKRLTDPDYNTALGRAHLGTLLETFDGSYILTLAAYNAGKHRVLKWLKDYGDPRHPDADPIDWIESIPYQETRNYVQRILEGIQVYRHRLAGQPVLIRLEQDLKRAARSEPDFAKPLPRPKIAMNL